MLKAEVLEITMFKLLFATSLLSIALPAASFAAPIDTSRAQNSPQPTAEELYQACTQNRAETLPNPFVDVSPKDWAYKAVLTMHYCGAFRQAAPRSLFERKVQPTPQSSVPTTPQSSVPNF